MIYPGNDSTLSVTSTLPGNSFEFVWETSIDPDGDTVTYFFLFYLQDVLDDTLGSFVTLDTTVIVVIDSIFISKAAEIGAQQLAGVWEVFAHDGESGQWANPGEIIVATNGPLAITVSIPGEIVEIVPVGSTPKGYALHPAYPNPFNPMTRLDFDLPEAADVNMVIFDLLGREVATLVSLRLDPGRHSVHWHGVDSRGHLVHSGVYIARLATPDYTKSIKLVLLK